MEKVALVLHGWNGHALVDTRNLLDDRLDDSWAVVAYDYHSLNAYWPDKSGADLCLRDHIVGLHDATGKDSANIFLVGHSMGGILSRFTLARYPELADLVGGVVTLDTPHLGSPFGSSLLSQLFGNGGDGGKCLALHHPGDLPAGCELAPYIPQQVPVAQIAGAVTLTRTFLLFGSHKLATDGDGTVWNRSQTGYVLSGNELPVGQTVTAQRVSCDFPMGLGWSLGSVLFQSPARWASGQTASLIKTGSPGRQRRHGDTQRSDAQRNMRASLHHDFRAGIGSGRRGAYRHASPGSPMDDHGRWCRPRAIR